LEKHILRSKVKLLSFALVLLIIGSISAKAAKADNTPEQAAQSFYRWYLKELSREGGNPIKQKSIVLKSVSKRLGKWIYSPAYSQYGADYIIDAQDFDENWDATPTKAVVKGNVATFKVMLAPPKGKKSNFTQTLAIKMVRENGAWKIDSVNNRKLFG
jgi:hypothetical protein